jgi:polyisoprenoid-binding protein YceI
MTSRIYPFEANAVQVHFEVRWFGVVTVRGSFAGVEGQLTLPRDGVSQPEVVLAVDARSVQSGLKLRDHHLRAERFLCADLHPSIRFTSRGSERERGRLVVQGELTLRGVTTPIRATCPIDEVQRDGEQVRACAQFVISRSRHGVGVPAGITRYNPLLLAIADAVSIRVQVRLPAEAAAGVGLVDQGARPRATTGHDDST